MAAVTPGEESEEIEPLGLLHSCPRRELPQTELWQRGPLLSGRRETPRGSPCGGRPEGTEWKEMAGGAQLHSPQVRRVLISWIERQTDRRTLHSLQLCFPGSPRAFCLSFWGAAGGTAIGSRSREAPGPHSHTHTQASMYRDTATRTHTSTHKHAPMPINTRTRTNMYRPTGITGEHPMGPWRGGVSSSP